MRGLSKEKEKGKLRLKGWVEDTLTRPQCEDVCLLLALMMRVRRCRGQGCSDCTRLWCGRRKDRSRSHCCC